MKNKYEGRCVRCGGTVPPGAGTIESKNGNWLVSHTECPEITSGLGIGGAGSDDYNINTEQNVAYPTYTHGQAPAGQQTWPERHTEHPTQMGDVLSAVGQQIGILEQDAICVPVTGMTIRK